MLQSRKGVRINLTPRKNVICPDDNENIITWPTTILKYSDSSHIADVKFRIFLAKTSRAPTLTICLATRKVFLRYMPWLFFPHFGQNMPKHHLPISCWGFLLSCADKVFFCLMRHFGARSPSIENFLEPIYWGEALLIPWGNYKLFRGFRANVTTWVGLGTQRSALSLKDNFVKIFSERDRSKTNLNLSFKLMIFNMLPNYLISMLEMVFDNISSVTVKNAFRILLILRKFNSVIYLDS